jgi:O-antigen/teichoic acid export membrane protein
VAFIGGVISGAERLVWLSGMNCMVATGRFILVLPLIMFVNNSPWVFFAFQVVVGAVELVWLAIQAYHLLPVIPADQRIRWEWAPIKPVLKFALSIAITSSIWVFVTQTDKLVLSKILSLTDYGYFTVAVLLASGIMIASGPISNALMPRMARLQAEGKHEELIALYRQATQMVTVVATPVTLVLAFLSSKVLWLWTGDADLVIKAAPALTLYAVGYGFLAVAAFPYYLQYAKGDLKLHLLGNGLFVIVLIPSVIWASNHYGMTGAGWAWLISNIIYFFSWVPLVHHRFAPGLHIKWLLSDIGSVVWPALTCSAIMMYFIEWSSKRRELLLEVILYGLLMLLFCASLKYKNIKLKIK